LIVPRWFFESLEDFHVFAFLVVVNDDGFEVFFDRFDERRMGEDSGPKDLAATSSGDFLEEDEDGLAALLGRGEGFIEIA